MHTKHRWIPTNPKYKISIKKCVNLREFKTLNSEIALINDSTQCLYLQKRIFPSWIRPHRSSIIALNPIKYKIWEQNNCNCDCKELIVITDTDSLQKKELKYVFPISKFITHGQYNDSTDKYDILSNELKKLMHQTCALNSI